MHFVHCEDCCFVLYQYMSIDMLKSEMDYGAMGEGGELIFF